MSETKPVLVVRIPKKKSPEQFENLSKFFTDHPISKEYHIILVSSKVEDVEFELLSTETYNNIKGKMQDVFGASLHKLESTHGISEELFIQVSPSLSEKIKERDELEEKKKSAVKSQQYEAAVEFRSLQKYLINEIESIKEDILNATISVVEEIEKPIAKANESTIGFSVIMNCRILSIFNPIIEGHTYLLKRSDSKLEYWYYRGPSVIDPTYSCFLK